MRVLLISDLHLNITKEKSIRKLFEKASEEKFDIIINAGDNSGGRTGFKPTRVVAKLMREFWPDKPIIATSSNHEVWTAGTTFKSVYGGYGHKNPSLEAFNKNYQNITDMYKEQNIHFLDEDGIYIHPDWPDIKFLGNAGWYAHPNPPTNDIGYMPSHNDEGVSSHLWMLNKAEKKLQEHFDQLDKTYDTSDTIVFISHFPVVKAGIDYKGRFEDFSWSESIGDFLQSTYGCKYFFEGHSHMFHNGPLKYNCGSNYYDPKYLIVEII